jgi:hypothetical protein
MLRENLLLLLLLFVSTANWFLFGGDDATIRQKTQMQTYITDLTRLIQLLAVKLSLNDKKVWD